MWNVPETRTANKVLCLVNHVQIRCYLLQGLDMKVLARHQVGIQSVQSVLAKQYNRSSIPLDKSSTVGNGSSKILRLSYLLTPYNLFIKLQWQSLAH